MKHPKNALFGKKSQKAPTLVVASGDFTLRPHSYSVTRKCGVPVPLA